MIKKIAWETFKNTGDINTYLELKQIEHIEDKIEKNDVNFEEMNYKVEEGTNTERIHGKKTNGNEIKFDKKINCK